jgi:hypothetical protein
MIGQDVRRGRALVALWLWGAALYVGPLLHNLDHRDDHTHGAGRAAHAVRTHAHPHARPHAHDGDHGEPGAWHTDGLPPAVREAAHTPRGSDPDHGLGSILHFAAAMLDDPVAVAAAPGSAPEAAAMGPATALSLRAVAFLPTRGPPPHHG